MTDREYFVKKVGEEVGPFERVFRALPEDKLDYTPHPNSKTARALFHQMVGEAISFKEFLTTGKNDWSAAHGEFTNSNEMVGGFLAGMNEAKDLANGMSEEEWAGEAVATMGGQEVWKSTRGEMAWGLLLDLVHHRGQLSTYIRPMGGKVPSIYGPSGDDQGM